MRSTPISIALAVVLAAAPVPSLVGQEQPGQYLVGGMATTSAPFVQGGLFVADSATGSITAMGNVPPVLQNVASLCADPRERGLYYAGTFAPNGFGTGAVDLVEFRAASGLVSSWRVVNAAPLPEDQVLGLAVVDRDLVFVGRQSVGRVARSTGLATTILATGPEAGVTATTCDGRYVYLAANVRDVYRVDLYRARAPELVHHAQIGFVDLIQAMAVDARGDLWLAVVDSPFGGPTSSLRLVRRDDGTLASYVPLPFAGPRSVAVDFASGDVVIAGGVQATSSGLVVVRGGVVLGAPFGALPNPLPGLALDRGLPLHRFGPPCPSHLGESWIHAEVLPAVGREDYAVWLRGSLPSAVHAVVLSLDDGHRLDLLPLGAPGCEVRVAPFAEGLALADDHGVVRVPLPVPAEPLLRGLAFAIQLGVLDPQANALGVALSQTGGIAIP